MNYRVQAAVSDTRDILPIRGRLGHDGYYRLLAANGEHRLIAAGNANTAWANAGWPKRGKWAVVWQYAAPRSAR